MASTFRRWLRVEMPRAVFALCFDGDTLNCAESANYGVAVVKRAGCGLHLKDVTRALRERRATFEWVR